MATPTPKYELELWTNGVQIGDITKLAKNRKFALRRNDSESLEFSLDLTAFEQYCAAAGQDPLSMLVPDATDVVVKRRGNPYFGVQVKDAPITLGEGGASLDVKCLGFLDLFADRYVTVSYEQTEATQIGWGLIDTTQSRGGPGDDFGIVQGSQQFATDKLRDRVYDEQNVKEGLVNLTKLIDGNFDFKFTYDKQFETYKFLGSRRPNQKLTYPYNVRSMTVSNSAMNLFNYIKAIGSGFGEEALRVDAPDADSRTNYYTREKIVTFNDIVELPTLEEHAYSLLAQLKEILKIPKLQLNGAQVDLDVVGIGDILPVEVQGHPYIPLLDNYRIEQLEVALDENDAEDITLTVDNYGV